MRIRIIRTARIDKEIVPPGEIREVPAEIGRSLIQLGKALPEADDAPDTPANRAIGVEAGDAPDLTKRKTPDAD